jgi:hypothetical protein
MGDLKAAQGSTGEGTVTCSNRKRIESALSGRAAPELERLVVAALGLSRRDPSLTRALPVLLWRRRGELDLAKVVRLAKTKGRERTLGSS